MVPAQPCRAVLESRALIAVSSCTWTGGLDHETSLGQFIYSTDI